MKKIFILLFIELSAISYSQNLSFDEIINIREMDLANAEEYLTSRGWSYIGGTKPDSNKLGVASFAYKQSSQDNKAQSFLHFFSPENSLGQKRISLQTNKKEKYTDYLSKIKSLNCKIIKTELLNDKLKKVYQGTSTTFVVSINMQKDEFISSTRTIYVFFILDNSDYQATFEKHDLEQTILEEPIDSIGTQPLDITDEDVIKKPIDSITAESLDIINEDITDDNKNGNKVGLISVSGDYLIGNWKLENLTIIFSNDGSYLIEGNQENADENKWKLIDNQLLLESKNAGTKIRFTILSNDENSFEYKIDNESEIYSAHRIGQ